MAEKQKANDGKQEELSDYVRMDKHEKHFIGKVPNPPTDYHPQLKHVSREPFIGERRSQASLKTRVSAGNVSYELDSYCTLPTTEKMGTSKKMEPTSETQATKSKKEDHCSDMALKQRHITRSHSAEIPDYENLETFTEKRASVSKIEDDSIRSAPNPATGKELHKTTKPCSNHQSSTVNPRLKVVVKKESLKASVPVHPGNSGSGSTREYKNVKDDDGVDTYYNTTNDLKDK